MTTSWPTMAAQEDDAETTATQVAEAIVRAEEARLARAQRMTPEEVGAWVEETVGLPQYKACFVENFVGGSKLRDVDASRLSHLGVRDFNHIKELASAIRELFNLPAPNAKRSIADSGFTTH